MWRHLTRGIQHRLRKTNCFEKTDSYNVKTDGDNAAAPYQNKRCRIIQSLLPASYQNCCLKKYTRNKENKKDYYENPSGNLGQHTLFEAFGWSGALVFGWAISKHLWLAKKFSQDEENKFVNDNGFIRLLAQIVKTQPPVAHVLPQLQSVSTVNKTVTAECNEDSSSDEEFDKAAKELLVAHERAIGEALNRRGIACLSKSTGSEAIKFFLRAAEFKYPPASFNMGQCYELGIGIKQDFRQAADWYKIASEQGHATAMYNLGVFYAHGWGGLLADIDCAKSWFVKAAKLGQPDAIAALDKEASKIVQTELMCKSDSDLCLKSTHKTPASIFVNNIKHSSTDEANLFQKSLGPDCNWNISFSSTIIL